MPSIRPRFAPSTSSHAPIHLRGGMQLGAPATVVGYPERYRPSRRRLNDNEGVVRDLWVQTPVVENQILGDLIQEERQRSIARGACLPHRVAPYSRLSARMAAVSGSEYQDGCTRSRIAVRDVREVALVLAGHEHSRARRSRLQAPAAPPGCVTFCSRPCTLISPTTTVVGSTGRSSSADTSETKNPIAVSEPSFAWLRFDGLHAEVVLLGVAVDTRGP